MRVMVDAAGYAGATDAFRDANHVAVLLAERLGRELAAGAGMAGNDATSADFARTYDDTAREALDAIADLAAAFAGLGRLTTATSRNHRAAEEASTIGVSSSSGWHLTEGDYAVHRPAPPPTCVGAQEPSLGPVDRWVLDHVEGFVWPGADVDRLSAAADTWDAAADDVRSLTAYSRTVATSLGTLISPEVPLALDAVAELRALVDDTADQLAALGRACREYADAVRAAHDQTRALLAELAQVVVEGMVLGAAVGAVTGGTATAAVAGATLARIAAASPRFAMVLARLAATAGDLARAGRTAQASLAAARARLAKFLKLELRSERGSIRVPGRIGASRSPGWLRAHEKPPGHTLDKHVGKSPEELLEQCTRDKKRAASSFFSETEAERLVEGVIESDPSKVEAWLASGSRNSLPLELDFGRHTGITVTKLGEVSAATGVRVVLIPKAGTPDGWQLLTAFPQ